MISHKRRPTLIDFSPARPERIQILGTVRGDTAMPSFRNNSFAIRSSPQVGFSRSIWRISSRRFLGSAGRPFFRDFHLQNIRNAVRCHLNVSGLTMTSAFLHSKNRASAIIASRVAHAAGRGLAFRSLNRASCLRRNRFSAINVAREDIRRRRRVSNRNCTDTR